MSLLSFFTPQNIGAVAGVVGTVLGWKHRAEKKASELAHASEMLETRARAEAARLLVESPQTALAEGEVLIYRGTRMALTTLGLEDNELAQRAARLAASKAHTWLIEQVLEKQLAQLSKQAAGALSAFTVTVRKPTP